MEKEISNQIVSEKMSVAEKSGTATDLTTNFERTNLLDTNPIWVKSRAEALMKLKFDLDGYRLGAYSADNGLYRN